jgi:hypothetical protein
MPTISVIQSPENVVFRVLRRSLCKPLIKTRRRANRRQRPARPISTTFSVPDCVTARWGLLYNLYSDLLLGFNMFPQFVYETREYCFGSYSPVPTRFKPSNERKRGTIPPNLRGPMMRNLSQGCLMRSVRIANSTTGSCSTMYASPPRPFLHTNNYNID